MTRRPNPALRGSAANAALVLALLQIATCADAADPPLRPGVRVETVARRLEIPWSLALSRDGRLFVAERPGRIRIIDHDTLIPTPWATVPAFDGTGRGWETGLMGLALHPDFPSTPFVYVCYTQRTTPTTLVNRVARLVERNGVGEALAVLLDDIPAGNFHNGCRVKVGPDRKLYVTTGDAYRREPAQQMSSLAGKVLRLNLDGSVPADNPFSGSLVWTLGHRNPQGIAWEPYTGVAYLTEHGDGFVDEINVLERGANYGWPTVQGRRADSRYKDPALVFHMAPGGAAFLADTIGSMSYDLIVASLRGTLLQLGVDGLNVSIATDSVLAGFGRFRDVIAGPDNSVYVSTSNRDGRRKPRRGDDRILRVWFDAKTVKAK